MADIGHFVRHDQVVFDVDGGLHVAAIKTSEQMSDAAAKTYKQGAQAADYVSRNTAEQPLLALLIAGAVGYAIAYMIHSR